MKLTKLSKADLYQVIKEEGFLLPKLTSTACKLSYLVNVRAGNEYCPRSEEVQVVYCENPPKKMIMLQIIYDELQRRGDSRTLTFDEKHLPDVDWCISAISALDPLHPIFEPGYMPSNEQRGRRGRRYMPAAEELVYMLDFQSAASKQTGADGEQTQNQYEKNPRRANTPKNAKWQHQEQGENFQGQRESQYNPCFKNFPDKFEKDDKGSKHQPVYDTNQNQSVNANMNQTHNLEKPGYPESKEQIQPKHGPLINMLRELEQKGILNECMMDYIKIQREYEKREGMKIQKEMVSIESPKMQKKKERFANAFTEQSPPNFIRTPKSQALAHQVEQVKKNLKIQHASKFLDERDEKKIEEPEIKDETKWKKNERMKQPPKLSMNQLMDESHFNMHEYDEIAFQDILEEYQDGKIDIQVHIESPKHNEEIETSNQDLIAAQLEQFENQSEDEAIPKIIHIV